MDEANPERHGLSLRDLYDRVPHQRRVDGSEPSSKANKDSVLLALSRSQRPKKKPRNRDYESIQHSGGMANAPKRRKKNSRGGSRKAASHVEENFLGYGSSDFLG